MESTLLNRSDGKVVELPDRAHRTRDAFPLSPYQGGRSIKCFMLTGIHPAFGNTSISFPSSWLSSTGSSCTLLLSPRVAKMYLSPLLPTSMTRCTMDDRSSLNLMTSPARIALADTCRVKMTSPAHRPGCMLTPVTRAGRTPEISALDHKRKTIDKRVRTELNIRTEGPFPPGSTHAIDGLRTSGKPKTGAKVPRMAMRAHSGSTMLGDSHSQRANPPCYATKGAGPPIDASQWTITHFLFTSDAHAACASMPLESVPSN